MAGGFSHGSAGALRDGLTFETWFCRGRDDNDRGVGACAALFDRGYLDREFDRLYRCVYRIMGDCLDSKPV